MPEHDWITRFLRFYKNTEPPRIFLEWTAVSVIAACLQRKCYLTLGQRYTFPNLYVILVAESGIGKSTAIRFGEELLRQVEGIFYGPQKTSASAVVEAMTEAYHVDTFGDDAYVHSSVNVFSGELKSFLRPGDDELSTVITDLFDCPSDWVYKTRTHGEEGVHNAWINIIGGTTPQLIQEIFPPKSIGAGLTGRMIFVYSDERPPPQPIGFDNDPVEQERLIEDLQRIQQMHGLCDLGMKWLAQWASWYNHVYYNPVFPGNDKFAGYNTRRGRYVLALSMIFAASQGDGLALKQPHILRAIDLLERTEQQMPRTFGGYGIATRSPVTRRILSILTYKPIIGLEELSDLMVGDVNDVEELAETLDLLKQAGYITYKPTHRGTVVKLKQRPGA